MALIVKKFRVRAGGKTYFPGDVITKIDKRTEKTLVELGYCEYKNAVVEKPKPEPEKVPEEKPQEQQDAANIEAVEEVEKETDGESEAGPDTSHPLTRQKGRGKK